MNDSGCDSVFLFFLPARSAAELTGFVREPRIELREAHGKLREAHGKPTWRNW
jgi:hypothetical protein